MQPIRPAATSWLHGAGVFLLMAAAAVPVGALAHRLWGLGLPVAGWRDAVVLFALAPWLEEWIVRANLQAWLHRRLRSGHAANAWSSAIFAALHAPVVGGLCVLWCVPGLALGELWRRCRSLGLNAALHAWFNLVLWWLSR